MGRGAFIALAARFVSIPHFHPKEEQVVGLRGPPGSAFPWSPAMSSSASLAFRGAAALALVLLAPASRAAASDVVVPSGLNAETRLAAGPMIAELADGTRVLSTGFFSAEQLSLQHADGSVTVYAEGIGSISGVAQSPSTGDLVVGDSFSATPLLVISDLNDDGDALDPGEVAPHPVALPPLPLGAAPLPFSVGFRPGAATDELYVTISAPSASEPGAVYRVADGACTTYATGFGYPGGLAWDGDTLYVAQNTTGFEGQVFALTDLNDDDDALDAGEMVLFAAGLAGGSGLVRADDGYFYLAGVTDLSNFTGALARLAPDGGDADALSDAIDPAYVSGLGSFSTSMVLLEGGAGFGPGSAADGELWCGQFNPDFSQLQGNVIVRSAPHATLALTGTVANNQAFTLHVGGEPGSVAVALFSLDQDDVTLYGIGDLRLGFGAPYLIVPMGGIGGGGEAALTLTLHNMGGAVGLPFTLQGFTLKAGQVGIGNALDLVVQP